MLNHLTRYIACVTDRQNYESIYHAHKHRHAVETQQLADKNVII